MFRLLIASITIVILVTGFVSQILAFDNQVVSAHRSGCHAAHSCPSDDGTYVCGDTGHGCNNEKGSSNKKKDSNSKNDDNKSSKSESESETSKSTITNNPSPALPKSTSREGIEISGVITRVIDGDTLEVNDIAIRLALVNTPEVGEAGYSTAKEFVIDNCLNKNGEVDIDDGQRRGSFGREIGVVYCNGMNLNQALMSNNLAVILTEFCEVSEFANEPWAEPSCSPNSNQEEDQNISNNEDPNSEVTISRTTESNENGNILSDPSNYQLITRMGGLGTGHGQFNHPASIETDQNGQRIYVADLDNNRIQVLDGDGNFITQWGTFGNGEGQFNGPGSIAVDDDHKIVFVADIQNNRIQKFDTEGNFITQWGILGKGAGEFDHPGDIALDPDEEILYVTDIYNNRIQKFYYDGNYISEWGKFGTGDGEFNRPAGISIDPENKIIYVSDTANNRVQVFNTDGSFTGKWGSLGSNDGQFVRPDGILYGASDNLVYIADRRNHRIQVFDDQGSFVNKWQISDSQSEDVIKPRDIAIDSAGQAYIVDKDHSNVLIYDVQGNPLTTVSNLVNEDLIIPNTMASEITNDPTRHGKSYFAETFETRVDDPVYVVSHSTKRDRLLGDLYYDSIGEIENRGEEDVSFVKIIATFYDKDDIVIGTDYTYTDPSDLRPGQKAPYDISISDSDVDVNEIARASYTLEWD